MERNAVESRIESLFREQVQGDKRVRNAYLLVNSNKLGINLYIAEGKTGDLQAHPEQPNHLASVGKLFTASLIGILHDRGLLSFDDEISKYLDEALVNGLHVYKGVDYSRTITIRHLLTQTSGLNDVFYHLLKRMMKDSGFTITTPDAIAWGKENLKPVAVPGKRHFYTDTNYYLLGFIIERVTQKPFYESMHELIFEPLGMSHAYMHGFSRPKVESEYQRAGLFFKGVELTSIPNLQHLDHAGGSVTAPLSEYLIFMKSLIEHKIVRGETLNRMLNDDIYMGFPTVGFNYGYSIWKMRNIPLIMPKDYYSWGCVGATGAYMFYHPATESYIIGSFNDFAYRGKAIEFMARRVIKNLLNYMEHR